MVHGFVKQSGGTLTIYSELDIGTTVNLYFPLVDVAVRPLGQTSPRTKHRGGSEFILIVDDRKEVARLAEDMLVSLGYRTHVALTPKDALMYAEHADTESAPNLLFSDVVMPGTLNGYTLAQEIRRKLPGIKILLTTGFDRDLGGLGNVAPAEFEIIKKPYRLADLAVRVRSVLDGPTGATV